VIRYVLAAPGSGKTTVTPHLRALLPGRVVLDWDAFMESTGALAGVAIPQAPHTWASYERLVRTIVDQIGVDVVLLGCAPRTSSAVGRRAGGSSSTVPTPSAGHAWLAVVTRP
jgi:hypothetical protein